MFVLWIATEVVEVVLSSGSQKAGGRCEPVRVVGTKYRRRDSERQTGPLSHRWKWSEFYYSLKLGGTTVYLSRPFFS